MQAEGSWELSSEAHTPENPKHCCQPQVLNPKQCAGVTSADRVSGRDLGKLVCLGGRNPHCPFWRLVEPFYGFELSPGSSSYASARCRCPAMPWARFLVGLWPRSPNVALHAGLVVLRACARPSFSPPLLASPISFRSRDVCLRRGALVLPTPVLLITGQKRFMFM